jgi:tetratricopeptide (TPR) repeat protein
MEERVTDLISRGLYDEALELIGSVPVTAHTAQSIHPYRAYVLFRQGRHGEALSAVEELLERFPINPKAKEVLFLILSASSSYEHAYLSIREWWEDSGCSRLAYVHLLGYSMLLGRAVDEFNGEDRVLASLGHLWNGRMEMAVEVLEGVDDRDRNKQYMLGLIAVRTGSVYVLDYLSVLPEDVLVDAFRRTTFIEGRCKYCNEKILRIAQRALGMEKLCFGAADLSKCGVECELENLRIEADVREQDAAEDGVMGHVIEDIRKGAVEPAMEKMRFLFRKETAAELFEHLEESQHKEVLVELALAFYRKRLRVSFVRTCCSVINVYLSLFDDRANGIVQLLHELKVREAVELLELEVFDGGLEELIELLEGSRDAGSAGDSGECEEKDLRWEHVDERLEKIRFLLRNSRKGWGGKRAMQHD